jgi:uncharacterized protein (DUF2236 family)
VLGAIPDGVPQTWRELQQFLTAELESGRIAVGREARELAPAILRPALGRLVWPVQYAGELVTIGSLPPSIRRGYGFRWDAVRERRMHRAIAALRTFRAMIPDRLARWPEARA